MNFPGFREMSRGDTDMGAAGFNGDQKLDINTA
jgi:hypothetical protein